MLINKTAPVGSTEDPETRYDDEGNKIAYNELMYKEDLEKPKYAKNPYIFLFKDYEKKWKHYEVFVMLFKLALMVPCVLLASSETGQAGVTLIIVLVALVVSKYTAPFFEDLEDHSDQVAKLTQFLTILVGLGIAVTGACSPAARSSSSSSTSSRAWP